MQSNSAINEWLDKEFKLDISYITLNLISFLILGEKFPWTIKARDFSIYSLHDCQKVYYLLKPMAISTTLALTANKHPPSETEEKPGLGLGVHTDMPAVIFKCSDVQVRLTYLDEWMNENKMIEW